MNLKIESWFQNPKLVRRSPDGFQTIQGHSSGYIYGRLPISSNRPSRVNSFLRPPRASVLITVVVSAALVIASSSLRGDGQSPYPNNSIPGSELPEEPTFKETAAFLIRQLNEHSYAVHNENKLGLARIDYNLSMEGDGLLIETRKVVNVPGKSGEIDEDIQGERLLIEMSSKVPKEKYLHGSASDQAETWRPENWKDGDPYDVEDYIPHQKQSQRFTNSTSVGPFVFASNESDLAKRVSKAFLHLFTLMRVGNPFSAASQPIDAIRTKLAQLEELRRTNVITADEVTEARKQVIASFATIGITSNTPNKPDHLGDTELSQIRTRVEKPKTPAPAEKAPQQSALSFLKLNEPMREADGHLKITNVNASRRIAYVLTISKPTLGVDPHPIRRNGVLPPGITDDLGESFFNTPGSFPNSSPNRIFYKVEISSANFDSPE